MRKSTTTRPAKSTADDSPRPVRVRHAACPRCDGPIYYHPDHWLYCTRCAASRQPIPFALTSDGKN